MKDLIAVLAKQVKESYEASLNNSHAKECGVTWVAHTRIIYGNKWAKIDIASCFVGQEPCNWSGKLMVALADIKAGVSCGRVVTIKAYGVPNLRWNFGNVITGVAPQAVRA